MKDKNIFVREDDSEGYIIKPEDRKTFKEIVDEYYELKTGLEICQEKLDFFEEKIRDDEIPTYEYYKENKLLVTATFLNYKKEIENNSFNENDYDLTKQLALYTIVHHLIRDGQEKAFEKMNINLCEEIIRIDTYSDIHKYLSLKTLKNYYEDGMNGRLDEITFELCTGSHEYCIHTRNHIFIRMDDELKCVCCDFSTKEFDLTQRELDFLTICADKKNILLKGITKKDLPLIKVIKENIDKQIKLSYPYSSDIDPYYMDGVNSPFWEDTFEEQAMWYDDVLEGAPRNMQIAIDRSHLQDAKKTEMIKEHNRTVRVSAQKYLFDLKAKELLEKVNKDIESAKALSDDVKSKQLFIEMCTIRKYEILILAGKHIPTLYHKLEDESEKDCLVKAYYNLQDDTYRTLSDYFDEDNGKHTLKENENLVCDDASFYDIYTADPEVNQKILDMKLRRKKD